MGVEREPWPGPPGCECNLALPKKDRCTRSGWLRCNGALAAVQAQLEKRRRERAAGVGVPEEMPDYPVTVCAACLQASCWHGEFICERSPSANVTVKMASELRALGREHPDNFSPEKIERVHGRFPAARRPI